jgi:arylsulfatase A-like enzyme
MDYARRGTSAIATGKRPFFVNISFSAPHYPIQSLPEYEKWNSHIGDPDRRAYAGMVTHMDEVIGKLVDQLRASGDLSNTHIFVFSDNGGEESWSNANYYNGRFPGRSIMGLNTPLRDFKTSVYEGGIRVPSLLFGPGVPAGVHTNQFTSALDVVRTIIDLAGADGADGLEGENLLDIARSQEPREADFYWQSNSEAIPYGGGHQEAVRAGRYKLVRSQRRFSWFPYRWKWPWDKYELFDLDADIGEQNDLSDSQPERVEQLLEKMNARQQAYRSQFEKLSAQPK